MNKISIIIKREYLTRVRRRTFIISTFLFPIIMILFIAGSVYLTIKSKETVQVAVPNDSFLRSVKSDSGSVIFQYDPTINQNNFDEKGYSGFLKRDDDSSVNRNFILFSRKQINSESRNDIETQLNKASEDKLLSQKGISSSLIDSLNKTAKVTIDSRTVDKEGNQKKSNADIGQAVGWISGILIYITMFIFGAMVMRGVMEEKMNRIAEVIVSSVKPFQLMMGKIIGIAAVGLTQFLMWIVLILILVNALSLFLPGDTVHQMQSVQNNPAVGQNAAVASTIAECQYHRLHHLCLYKRDE